MLRIEHLTKTYGGKKAVDDLICTANAFEWTVAEEPTEPAEESELPEGPAEAA